MRNHTVMAAVATAGSLIAACSTVSAPVTTHVPPISHARLLAVADLPAGWSVSPVVSSPTNACSVPPTTTSIVGPTGQGVQLSGAGSPATVVEYAVRSRSVLTTYGDAIRRLQTPTSCSQVSGGRTQSSTFDQVLPLPSVGNGSVCMLLTYDNGGVTSRAGYVIARQGDAVVVVGYSAPGSLDTTVLQRFTALAIRKLNR